MKCDYTLFAFIYVSSAILVILSSKSQCTTFSLKILPASAEETHGRFPRRVTKPTNKTSSSTINLRYRSPEFVLKRVANNRNVEKLILEHDELTHLPRSLAELTRLRSVSLKDNRIGNIANVSFLNDLPLLQQLSLSRNPLKSLKGLRANSLVILEAQRCDIEELDETLPNSLPALVTLNLTGNPLGTVRKLISETLSELVLQDCHLKNLSSDSFEGLKKLTYLDLRDNELNTLPGDIFSGNNRLRFLKLGNNSLESVNVAWFNGTKVLEILDLSGNKISTVDESTFAGLLNLTELDLEKNRVDSLPNLRTAAFNVNLSGNSIPNKDVWDLSEMSRIERLDLSHNRLDGKCGNFKSPTMVILKLGYNNITRITKKNLAGLPNLTDLSLKGNRFSAALHPSIFEDNPMLSNVELDDNPWTCDCIQLYRMYHYLASGQRTIVTRLICTSPQNVTGQTWGDACARDWRHLTNVEDRVQSSKDWMIGVSAAFGIFLLLATITYIIFTYKKDRSEIPASV